MSLSQQSATVLVTGGAGYIGSHACVALLEAGYRVVVLDNLCNSSALALQAVAAVAGQEPAFVLGDVRDEALLQQVFERHRPLAVMHFAGLKAVGESVREPQRYFSNNVHGAEVLLSVMEAAGVRTLVFSSSATVYGEPLALPITERHRLAPLNPYGETKREVEDLLRKQVARNPRWSVALLRYFNPVGAHPSGQLGEDPRGVPNNLMPYIAQVAVGKRAKLQIYGNDYDTDDGTGVRDYIHVMDLVAGHVQALTKLLAGPRLMTLNLGTGHGVSVLQLVRVFEQVNGVRIPYEFAPRRQGDSAANWADASAAAAELGWRARLGVEDMCRDAWHWQQRNPLGFKEP